MMRNTMKKDTKNLIQKKLFKHAIKAIFNVIIEQRHGLLRFADGYIERDYVIIVFNDLYAFQFKWATKSVLCVNGAAKSVSIDVLDYAHKNINYTDVEKKMRLKGKRVWQNNEFI